MKETISITELLNRIKKQKKKVLEIDNTYLNSDQESLKSIKLLLTIYNPNKMENINGISIDKVEKDIKEEFNEIIDNIRTLRNLLIIKEQVNSTFKLVVPNIFNSDKDITLSIAQILILKSPMIKTYYYRFAERCKNDIEIVNNALNKYNDIVFNPDNINKYVIAKFNSLNINIDPNNIQMLEMLPDYEKYANEYKKANTMYIYDPLNITEKSKKWYENITSFYDIIDLKLLEFNSITKIIIDQETGYWEPN